MVARRVGLITELLNDAMHSVNLSIKDRETIGQLVDPSIVNS
jgi:hypothetical protein